MNRWQYFVWKEEENRNIFPHSFQHVFFLFRIESKFFVHNTTAFEISRRGKKKTQTSKCVIAIRKFYECLSRRNGDYIDGNLIYFPTTTSICVNAENSYDYLFFILVCLAVNAFAASVCFTCAWDFFFLRRRSEISVDFAFETSDVILSTWNRQNKMGVYLGSSADEIERSKRQFMCIHFLLSNSTCNRFMHSGFSFCFYFYTWSQNSEKSIL